jgi:hypothetical protein
MVLAAVAVLICTSLLVLYLLVRGEEQRLLKRNKASLSPPGAKPN